MSFIVVVAIGRNHNRRASRVMGKVNTSLLGLLLILTHTKTLDDTTKEVKKFWTQVSLLSSLLA